MKKVVISFFIGLLLGTFISIAFSNQSYWEYSNNNYPENEDSIKAEINKAIALEKIAEEGITLNIVFKNKLEVDKKE